MQTGQTGLLLFTISIVAHTSTMAPPARYPRATIRKILKGHSQKRVAREVDALMYLDYILFMEEYGFRPHQKSLSLTPYRLMKNAERKSKESGDKRIAARDIRRVTSVCKTSSHPQSQCRY